MVFTKVCNTVSYILVTGACTKAAGSQKVTWEQVSERTNPTQSKLETKQKKYFSIVTYIPSHNFDSDINMSPRSDARD